VHLEKTQTVHVENLTLISDPGLLVLPGQNAGTVLVGGSPYTVLSLKPVAAQVVQSLLNGATVADAAHQSGVSTTAAHGVAQRLLNAGMAEPLYSHPYRFGPQDVTVVIPCHNEAARIGTLISKLFASADHDGTNCIVVDDGSTDNTAAIAEAAGAQVIRRATPGGPGVARMTGLAAVTTPIVVFLDADIVAPPLAIDTLITPLLAPFNDDAVTLVAPRVTSLAGPGWLAAYEMLRSPLDLGSRRAGVRSRSRVAYLPSAVLAARVDQVRALGGFDPLLRTGEDVDLVWRTIAAGQTVRYEADVHATHHPRSSWRAFIRQRRSYGRSAAPLDQRHPTLVAPVAASGWSVVAWGLAVLGGPIGVASGLATALTTAALLERKLSMIDKPRALAWKLAMRGHWGVGRQLASATWRAWLPIIFGAALVSRRARIALLLSLLPYAADSLEPEARAVGPAYLPIRLLDDASYGVGVWQGCLETHSFRALLPHLSNWPPKRPG
jgi:mycofactocin glycosyltransferase